MAAERLAVLLCGNICDALRREILSCNMLPREELRERRIDRADPR